MTDLPDAIEAAQDVLAGRGNGTYDEALDAIRWLLAGMGERIAYVEQATTPERTPHD